MHFVLVVLLNVELIYNFHKKMGTLALALCVVVSHLYLSCVSKVCTGNHLIADVGIPSLDHDDKTKLTRKSCWRVDD